MIITGGLNVNRNKSQYQAILVFFEDYGPDRAVFDRFGQVIAGGRKIGIGFDVGQTVAAQLEYFRTGFGAAAVPDAEIFINLYFHFLPPWLKT
jgi:hypothetical protein